MSAILRVLDGLPAGFEGLRAEARAEGFTHMDRLAAEWAEGTLRFAGAGERLLAASIGGTLAGLGGVTIETALPDALRLRRFYTRPAFRRHGVGRALADALTRHADALGRDLVLNAIDPAAAAFWERRGFEAAPGPGFTHRRRG